MLLASEDGMAQGTRKSNPRPAEFLISSTKRLLQHNLPERAVSKCSNTCLLLDHLVGAGEQWVWHCYAERLSGLQVDHKLVFGRCLHRQVGRFLALEDAIDITG